MISALRHRGPDADGIDAFGGVVLGMTRLAILDVSPAGGQPMSSPDGLVHLVYNGETYNYRELRQGLETRGHDFASSSDTEVVLRLYLEHGVDFVSRLRGMFALAIHDRRQGPGREKLLLARDPFGIKPLLYAQTPGELIFASEIKSLLASGRISPKIDPVALRLLLTFGSVTQPRTMLAGVRMLLPGHMLIAESGGMHIHPFSTLAPSRPELRAQSYKEQVEVVRSVLAEAVGLHLVSDVPVGAFLSGGLDSALLCALMLQAGAHELNTFSVGFEFEGKDLDESLDARETADHLGTRHHHVIVGGREAADNIARIARDLDQPSVDGVNSWFVSKAAKEHVTVAISGTGGDELFAGYPWFGQMQTWRHKPRSGMGRLLGRALSSSCFNPLSWSSWGPWLEEKRIAADFLSYYAQRYYVFGPTGAAKLLAPHLREIAGAGCPMRDDIRMQDDLPGGNTLNRTSALCLRGYTSNQLLRDIDAASMAHSLEVRVPFLDSELAGVALSLSEDARLDGCEPLCYGDGLKRILMDIAAPYLPSNFATRSKRGFSMPFGHWLRGPLREVFEDALSPAALQRHGYLDQAEVAAVRKRFERGEIAWMKPWLLMMFELWRREVLDGRHG